MIRRIRSKARRLSTAAIIFGAMEVTVGPRAQAAPLPGTLPIPCNVCVTAQNKIIPSLADTSVATFVTAGNTMTVNQVVDRAILNWQSFNISADGKVIFRQPDSNSIALNRIFDANPTEIFGSLQANGQLYLLNQNGFLFGTTARVNTGGLLATSLDMTNDIFEQGLLSQTQNGLAALERADNMASVLVQAGAQLTTNEAGQRILLAAKSINNQGTIVANDGQVILAAGEKLYVAASNDPELRGLLVEVDGGSKTNADGSVAAIVTNTGTVTAERGNITAVGLAINQSGRMTATTSVSKNGSIRLLARDTVLAERPDGTNVVFTAQKGGAITLGAGSLTAVNPDASDITTAVDEQAQSASTIEVVGKTVQFAGGSTVRAAGGDLSVVAASNPAASRADSSVVDAAARIRVDGGAVIDLSGSTATTSVTRNLVTVELRANELADKPLQRDGVLRGQTVVVDARAGTSLADVSGAVGLIGRDVLERTSAGGSAVFDSAGDVVVADNATIDVSGGVVNYAGGIMNTTQLIKADGSTVDIGKASADMLYQGIINPVYKLVSDRWGVVRYIKAPNVGKYEAGYTEGADAGKIQFMANAMVLNGDFIGTATNGANQRTADTMALGGQFIVGLSNASAASLSFRAPEIILSNQVVPVVASTSTSLPAGMPLYLTPEFITQGGFSRVQLASDQGITLAANTPIELAAGGAISLTAPRVNINSNIATAAGSIAASAVIASGSVAPLAQTGLFVGDDVTLNVNGLWVNDALTPLDQQPGGLVLTRAGSIALTQTAQNGVLRIGDDVSLHASGGAWLKQSGVVSGGSGGSITVASVNNSSADRNQTFLVGDHFGVDGFGVQGASGGSFTLRAPRLQINNSSDWLAAQQVGTSVTTGGTLKVGTALFSDFGFSKFTLQADHRALSSDASKTVLDVANGTHISLGPQTRLLDNTLASRASGTVIESFSSSATLQADQVLPASLTLRGVTELLDNNTYGAVRVGAGAVIDGNAGSTLNVSSNGDLQFDGAVSLAAGTVNMSVLAPEVLLDRGYVDRKLTVGSSARIDVSGTTILAPNDAGRALGEVLDGGSVALTANRGAVNVKAGSLIDVSGTQADLDVQIPGGNGYERHSIASTAGSVTIQAAQSIALQGDLQAQGGISNGVRNTGGSLEVALVRGSLGQFANTYPDATTARDVQLVKEATSTPTNGIASIDSDLVARSGVESLTLTATNQVSIGAGVDLQLGRLLTINAPQLAVAGAGTAKIAADYMLVGPSEIQTTAPTSTTGAGQLTLQADQMALRGSLALRNISQAMLSSNGDLQLQGYGGNPLTNPNALTGGRLLTQGDLTVRAQRVLPTTGAEYTIDATDHRVVIEQAGAATATPLSVAGKLTINAADIVQGGTVLAPFGSITLDASNSLSLLNGSITSVSGNGAVLPYGRVDNGNSWVWTQGSGDVTTVDAAPHGTIVLDANSINMASGSVLDVSGGGDLLAWQYTPGTGGKQDVLDPASSGYLKDTYVIVPAATQSIAYDPMMWAGSGLQPGQSIYIAAGATVPEGVYQLLPARYALVPGAYLVSGVSGYQNLPAGRTASTVDGATVVAGYYTFGDDKNAAARLNGFAIRLGSYVRTLAQYEDQLASSFFAARAVADGTTAALPRDAGTLVIAADQALSALGTVRGKGATGGANATVEIAAGNLEIDNTVQSSGTSGAIHLSATTLQNWNIGSLLLGGTRNDNQQVEVVSNNITVHGGATLVADEVVLVAGNAINVESGATVASTSDRQPGLTLDQSRFAKATTLSLADNDAAVLAVSDLHYLVTERSSGTAGDGATINVASGARVGTRGAVDVDADGAIALASNTLAANGASWSLGASTVTLGGTTATANGLTINSTLQTSLQTARAIDLRSAGDLNVAQATTLGNATTTDSITLQAARINNLAGNVATSFNANTIAVSGVNSSAGVQSAGNGQLAFNAAQIELGGGELGVSGFGTTTLNATGLVMGTDNGGLTTAGTLNVNSAAITIAGGKQTALRSNSDVVLSRNSVSVPAIATLATGGDLNVSGVTINDAARIIMPSGVVTLDASNSLQIQDGAVIDVSGYQPTLAANGSNGGAINLKSGGALSAASGSVLKVTGGPQAEAGSIHVDAAGAATLAGNISGAADSGFDGGEFSIHAQSLNDFSALNRTLEVGGFTEQRRYHVAAGDLTLAAGEKITAQQVELTTDSGAITINGNVIAASDAQRSSIDINAHNNVVIGGSAVLNASAIDPATQRAGSIELATAAGHIQMAAAANVQATGYGDSGSLTLRAPATTTDFNLDSLPADLSKVDSVVLEPVKSGGIYVLTSSNLTSTSLDAIRTNLANYVDVARNTTLNRFGLASASNVHFRPYADITRVGDLTVADYDFAPEVNNWRFGGESVTVSVRATGNLDLNGTLSDGFASIDTFYGTGLELTGTAGANQSSTSFNLVAGSDLASASMTATQRNSAADLQLGDGVIVRTGTGDIELTAARDIVIGSAASIYTGGNKAAQSISDDGEFVATFPDHGGSIALTAGRDVVGSVVTQAVSDWQIRWAPYKVDGSGAESAAFWGVDFARFGWNVGALGGGDVRIAAGRNVDDVSVAVADSVSGDLENRVESGGGNLSVTAGKDINTGYFYVAKGLGDLKAWGEFGASGNRSANGRNIGSFLLAGDSSYQLATTRGVLFEGMAQPTLYDPTQFSFNNESFLYFTRYAADSSLRLSSAGGAVQLRTGDATTLAAFGGLSETTAFSIYPAEVSVTSFASDINVLGGLNTMPSASGGVTLYAGRDINGNGQVLSMSDVDPAGVSGASATNVATDGATGVAARLFDNTDDVLHSMDGRMSSIAAAGDIDTLVLPLAEAASVLAGRDIRNLTLDTQQSGAASTSSVIAGRDIYYTTDATTRQIRVGGKGLLEVLAGRNIDLGFSIGISTTGDLLNGNLPDKTGADVIAMAGLSGVLDTESFMTDIVVNRPQLQTSLIAYVEKQTGRSGLDYATAANLLRTLDSKQWIQFSVDALFSELVASGREANQDSATGFKRGYAALASLFKDSDTDNNPFSGDISLPFSRIYTLDGGTIAMLAPGGKIDVGLANPPTLTNPSDQAFLDRRKPSELGIVAQQAGDVHIMTEGDVLVNTSRIFTLGGGDIAIWSSKGNIDAGKGAKSSISAPPPTLTVDAQGNVTINVGSAVAGSGIRTIVTSDAVTPGDVDLIAPAGFVNAGDAGIGSAGNLNIAAQRVVGLDNIQVGGASTGVPPETGGLGASLSGVTASAGSSTTTASNSITESQATDKAPAQIADAALSWLEVFVVGLGEENCKQDDLECLKRQDGK